MTLEEIRSMNTKRYVDDPVEIKEILDRFLDIKLEDFVNLMNEEDRYDFTEFFLLYYEFPLEGIKSMTLGEAICLLKAVEYVDSYKFTPSATFTKTEYSRLVRHVLMSNLLYVQKRSTEVKELFEISLKALMDFGRNESPKGEWDALNAELELCDRTVRDFSVSPRELIISPEVTLGQIANETAAIKRTQWKCFNPIFNYEQIILSADRIQEIVFFDIMREYTKSKLPFREVARRLNTYTDYTFEEYF